MTKLKDFPPGVTTVWEVNICSFQTSVNFCRQAEEEERPKFPGKDKDLTQRRQGTKKDAKYIEWWHRLSSPCGLINEAGEDARPTLFHDFGEANGVNLLGNQTQKFLYGWPIYKLPGFLKAVIE